ncbi:uncharacterized protein [Maniola hyperantus]|uniref:uncharacterized protein n=1 Tax=Aphantopus hyperantus TaxID=2795564 RepID=UPI002124BC8C
MSFLVFQIVFSSQFLKSSTAPVDSTANVTIKDCVNETLKEFIYERIGTSNEALAEFIEAFECAMANASNEYKKGLNQVGQWLTGFEDLVANRHNDLENLVNGEPCEDRDENIKKLKIAVNDTEATVASFKRIPDELRAILEKNIIETIVGNALDVIQVLENLECPENSTGNALKDFIFERIGTSNDALAEFIEAFECAMANGSNEYKKGLNQVGQWLTGFEDLVANRHNDLENLVNGEPCKDRDENIKKLEIAVNDTEATVASFKRIPDELRAILEENIIETIVGNALDVIQVLENLECPENKPKKFDLKQLIYKKIEASKKSETLKKALKLLLSYKLLD